MIALLLSCVVAQDAKLRTDVQVERVLFLGNSITRHGPAPKIGWTGDWGMAASAADKDYAHLVAAGIAALSGKKPDIKLANIADFERNLATYDLETNLKAELAFKPTLAIVAIGENVPPEAKAQFKAGVGKLLAALKNAGAPSLVVRSCFWADPEKDEILRQACAAAGGTFVDIAALARDESLYARSERTFEHAGVAAHPGDKGMKAIADAILAALKTPPK
jgi:hypothetical protein